MNAAREKVRVARCLQTLPLIKEAFRKGAVSYSKVRAMTRVANERNETFLLHIARYGTASHMERLISHYRKFKSRVGLNTANQQHAARELNTFWDDDGSLVLRGRLPGEVGAIVVKALEAAWDLAYESRKSEEPSGEDSADLTTEEAVRESSGVPSPIEQGDSHSEVADEAGDAGLSVNQREKVSAETPDRWTKPPRFRRRDEEGNHGLVDETFAAGRADALVMLCERFLTLSGQQTGSIDPYQVYVHVDTQTLSGIPGDHSHVEAGPELTAHTVRRLCCDAGLIPVHQSHHGEILNVGRKTRSIPPAMKRALRLRDQGCRFPGCTQYRHTDAHHIEHWADGGETRLSNLVTLCRYHHRLMHEGGGTVKINLGQINQGQMNRGEYQFHVPEQGFIPGMPVFPDPTELSCSLEDLNDEAGLSITSRTGDCQWTSESMDWDTGIQHLMDAEYPQGTEWYQGKMRACPTDTD